jgi:hypothetical protein
MDNQGSGFTLNIGPAQGGSGPSGVPDLGMAARAGMLAVMAALVARARALAPWRTGALARSVTASISHDGTSLVLTATAPHAPFVLRGTGLYGPHRRRIVPRHKQALFWQGAPHPCRSVRGQRPNAFLSRAYLSTDIQAAFLAGFHAYLAEPRP